MNEASGTHSDVGHGGTFLGGWGGVIAVLLGIGVALGLWPVVDKLVVLLHGALEDLGMSYDAATMTMYWLGMVAIGTGFFIAFVGSDVRMDRLRGGIGDWSVLVQEALIATGVASLWLSAAATWANFADEFNAYETVTELSAIGLLLLIVAAGVVIRLVRHRRSPEARTQP